MENIIKKIKGILATNNAKILINTVVSILIIVLGGYLCFKSYLLDDSLNTIFSLFIFSCVVMCIGLWGLITQKLLLEVIGSDNILVQNGEVIGKLEKDRIFWRFTKPKNMIFFSYQATIFHLVSETNPISANPKVKKISYSVETKGILDEDALHKFFSFLGQFYWQYHLHGNMGGWQKFKEGKELIIQSLLYEFNEKHSKELAELYNPLSNEQQTTFFCLISADLNPPLKEYGLEVNNAVFHV